MRRYSGHQGSVGREGGQDDAGVWLLSVEQVCECLCALSSVRVMLASKISLK